MGAVSDNLPDVKQALLLAREAAMELHLQPDPVPKIKPINVISMDEYARAEIRLWPPQCKDHDCISQELIDKNIYGENDASCEARRLMAHCDETLAELLQLARLFTKSDNFNKFDGVQSLDDASSPDAFTGGGEDTMRLKPKSLAEQITAIKDDKTKKEAKRKEIAERKEKSKNRQNLKLLREKHNLLTPKEDRRRRKEKAKQHDQGKIEYRIHPGGSKKRQAEDDPEMPTEKKSRVEKHPDIQQAECLGRLDTLSGRLCRRETSRKMIARCNNTWKQKRAQGMVGIAEKTTGLVQRPVSNRVQMSRGGWEWQQVVNQW